MRHRTSQPHASHRYFMPSNACSHSHTDLLLLKVIEQPRLVLDLRTHLADVVSHRLRLVGIELEVVQLLLFLQLGGCLLHDLRLPSGGAQTRHRAGEKEGAGCE